ncbi:MAG: peptidase U62 [Bryobacterales bacterium]|nr:peptidase U62 [Bryobacterales bacterium]
MRQIGLFFATFSLLGQAGAVLAAAPAPAKSPSDPPLIDTLVRELERNFQGLQSKADPPPYYISYSVAEEEAGGVSATLGAIENRANSRRRTLDCSVRVGSPALDNYHLLEGDRPRVSSSTFIPVEDRPDAIARLAWITTDGAWRNAAQRYLRVKGSAQVQARQDAKLPDYSQEKAVTAIQTVPRLRFNAEEWAPRLKRLSNEFNQFAGVLNSSVAVGWRREVRTFVSTEGARLQHGRNFYRITVSASAKAYDGNDVYATESFEAEDPARLPKEEVIAVAVRKVGGDLVKLLRAQAAQPYVGPAILSGRAAGVFFHEIFGHRIEGHRQRDETEGQTFTTSVNKAVLPEFLSVLFDPTRKALDKIDLNGWYSFDDQGIPARPVPLVQNGILKTFLMSRTPIDGFPNSNGHGRAQPGYEVVSRQSNLIVDSKRQVTDAELRKMLIEEVKKQNKPYGLFFEQVTGGYTTTRRQGLQAFTVIPLVVYRVFADGRTDELVRGADIVGTPLASFSRILATSDRLEVFNGFCGAESGSVPVSAISPALLVSEIEIQRKPESKDLGPILPRPRMEERQ